MTCTIEQIKELCEGVLKEEWRYTLGNQIDSENEPFIKASLIVIPELVAEVESLQSQVKEASAVIEFYDEYERKNDEFQSYLLQDLKIYSAIAAITCLKIIKAREWVELLQILELIPQKVF